MIVDESATAHWDQQCFRRGMAEPAELIRGIEAHGVAGASALARWQYACTNPVPFFASSSGSPATTSLQLIHAAFSAAAGLAHAEAEAKAKSVESEAPDVDALTPVMLNGAATAAGLSSEIMGVPNASMILDTIKSGAILLIPYSSSSNPAVPVFGNSGTLDFAIVVGCVVKVSISGAASEVADVGHTVVAARPQVGSLREGALAFLDNSNNSSPSSSRPQSEVGRLRLDTAFLEADGSAPARTERPPSQVGKLKGAHGFLEAQSESPVAKATEPPKVGKLAKDLSFLGGSPGATEAERPAKKVGKLNVNMAAFSSPTAEVEAPRARAQTSPIRIAPAPDNTEGPSVTTSSGADVGATEAIEATAPENPQQSREERAKAQLQRLREKKLQRMKEMGIEEESEPAVPSGLEQDGQAAEVDSRVAQGAVGKLNVDTTFLATDESPVSSPAASTPGKLNIDVNFLAGSDTTPSEKPRPGVGKLAVNTAFLESASSPPASTDRPPVSVGKLKDPHNFLASTSDGGPKKERPMSEVGRLNKDLSFLDSATSSPGVDAGPAKQVGRLSIDMSAFSPSDSDAESPRPRAQTGSPNKLLIGGPFNQGDGEGSNCIICDKKVYPVEKVSIDGETYHKWCLRCSECNKVLSAGSYAKVHGTLFCKPHFQQLFKSKGNYDEGFGHETRKAAFLREKGLQEDGLIEDAGLNESHTDDIPEEGGGNPEEAPVDADNEEAQAEPPLAAEDGDVGGEEAASVTRRPKPGRLVVDASFLESSSSPPPSADRPSPRVGKLKDPHSFLAADSETIGDKPKQPASVGKLTKDLAFLSNPSSPGVDGPPPKAVGRLSIDVAAFTSPESEPKTSRPKSDPPKKLVIGGAFAQGDDGASLSVCPVCDKKVYPVEKVSIDGEAYHKWCLRCSECNKVLSAGSYAKVHGILFCKPHFQQLFKSKGNYDEGFGHESRKRDFVQGRDAGASALVAHTDDALEDDGSHMILVVRHPGSADLQFIAVDLLLQSNRQCGLLAGQVLRVTGLAT